MSELKNEEMDKPDLVTLENGHKTLTALSQRIVRGEIITDQELKTFIKAGVDYHYQSWMKDDPMETICPFHSEEYKRYSKAQLGNDQLKAEFCQENARRARKAAKVTYKNSPADIEYNRAAQVWDALAQRINPEPQI